MEKKRYVWIWKAVSHRHGDGKHLRCFDSSPVFHLQHVKEIKLLQPFLAFPYIEGGNGWNDHRKCKNYIIWITILYFSLEDCITESWCCRRGPTRPFLYFTPWDFERNPIFQSFSPLIYKIRSKQSPFSLPQCLQWESNEIMYVKCWCALELHPQSFSLVLWSLHVSCHQYNDGLLSDWFFGCIFHYLTGLSACIFQSYLTANELEIHYITHTPYPDLPRMPVMHARCSLAGGSWPDLVSTMPPIPDFSPLPRRNLDSYYLKSTQNPFRVILGLKKMELKFCLMKEKRFWIWG